MLQFHNSFANPYNYHGLQKMMTMKKGARPQLERAFPFLKMKSCVFWYDLLHYRRHTCLNTVEAGSGFDGYLSF